MSYATYIMGTDPPACAVYFLSSSRRTSRAGVSACGFPKPFAKTDGSEQGGDGRSTAALLPLEKTKGLIFSQPFALMALCSCSRLNLILPLSLQWPKIPMAIECSEKHETYALGKRFLASSLAALLDCGDAKGQG